MPDFGIFRGFNDKLFGDKLYAGQLPINLGMVSADFFVGLLDLYPNAAAAYSLRKLRSGYTGSAIEVRRTNNDVADIGFTSTGELDTAALLAFTGTGALDNGFVTKWYDQSGNTINATQTTLANQPQIVSNGSVILQGTKSALTFDGINDAFNGSPTTSGAYTNYAVLKTNSQTGFRGIFTASQMMMLAVTEVSNKWGTYNISSINTQAANTDIRETYNVIGMISNLGTSGNFYRNGSGDGSYTGSGSQYSNPAYIGGATNQRLSANIQEIIFWQINQSSNRTGIETNINDFYSIY
jgi:hypothetical protein